MANMQKHLEQKIQGTAEAMLLEIKEVKSGGGGGSSGEEQHRPGVKGDFSTLWRA
jgi:hypothetical protein